MSEKEKEGKFFPPLNFMVDNKLKDKYNYYEYYFILNEEVYKKYKYNEIRRRIIMVVYIIIGLVVILLLYVLITYNSLVKSDNFVKEAFSTMDVYLKKRWDLIPNLVEVVKEYANYEKETIEKITTIRANSYESMSIDKKINVNEQLTKDLLQIMAVSENYPDLKASQNFIDLSQNLIKIEDEIANSRKYYNGTVRIFNNKIQMFPSNIIANLFGFHSANMFEANADEKNNVKVDL